MDNNTLLNISPIDGRYEKVTYELKNFFSEYAYIKYRLFVLKNEPNENTNKSNFDLVRQEWQELKKDNKKLKEIMNEAKKWFEETKDTFPKKSRQKQVKIDSK